MFSGHFHTVLVWERGHYWWVILERFMLWPAVYRAKLGKFRLVHFLRTQQARFLRRLTTAISTYAFWCQKMCSSANSNLWVRDRKFYRTWVLKTESEDQWQWLENCQGQVEGLPNWPLGLLCCIWNSMHILQYNRAKDSVISTGLDFLKSFFNFSYNQKYDVMFAMTTLS